MQERLHLLTKQGSQPGVYLGEVRQLAVPLCDLGTQQRIVAKLDEQMAALDRAKKALAEQREAATTLRSTVIRATLDPATHTTWPTYPLGDLLEKICNGVSALQNQDKIGLPVTRIETISTGSIDTDRVGYLNLPADHLRDHLLEPGDILFSHINSFERIGNCAVYSGTPNRLVHGMNLLRFKPRRSLVAPEYLLCYLRAPTARAFFSATARRAIGQASINIRDLSVMPIALPPLQIQKSIAEYLDNSSRQTDALVAALGVRVRTLDSLRTSLLNAAFSGEV
jgi:restriction endonuclease S subunit